MARPPISPPARPAPRLLQVRAKEPSMTLAACCMSHSPLIGLSDPPAVVVAEAMPRSAQPRLRLRVRPTVIVLFGVDHLNGFRYDVMPQFCIGSNADQWRYGRGGALDVPADAALQCAARRSPRRRPGRPRWWWPRFCPPLNAASPVLDQRRLIRSHQRRRPTRSPIRTFASVGAASGEWRRDRQSACAGRIGWPVARSPTVVGR